MMQNRIYDKLEEIDKRLSNMDTHLAVYNEQLKIHIEGTVQNRDNIKEIQKHVHMVNGGLKLLTVLSLIFGLLKYLQLI